MIAGPSVTVAGAGVLGLSVALALAEAGCAVRVFDPARPGANASGVAAGMLAPVFESALDPSASGHLDLLLAARDLWPDLARRIGVELDRRGALAAGAPDWLASVTERLNGLGARKTELTKAAIADLAPGLAPHLEAVLTREDWRIDAAPALAALRAACESAGVGFAARAARGAEGADWLVVATGAGRGLEDLAPHLALLTPIKGHILRCEGPPYTGLVVRGEGGYVTPDPQGRIVGATMEAGVSDPTPDPERAAGLTQAGAALFPESDLSRPSLAAGIRAATPDGLPMVGHAGPGAVLLAAGARRNGWLLAPLVARIIVACVMERDPDPHAARLDPSRFREGP